MTIENQWDEHILPLNVNEVESIYFLLQWLWLLGESYTLLTGSSFINFYFLIT